MKANFYDFILFLYLNHIKEDWEILTKWGKIYIYPFWWIRSFFVWVFFFLFLPAYWYDKSDLKKEVDAALNNFISIHNE